MRERSDAPFHLGPWRVEPRLNRLSGPAGSVQVEPKLLAVLACLARRSGQVVSREELLQAVWADRFVSDEVVRRAVYELRKLLGEEAAHPRYIETIPRAGYRLIAPVEWDRGAAEPPVAAGEPAGRPRRLRRVTVLAPTLLLAAVAGLAAIALLRLASRAAGEVRLTPFTAYPGVEFDPAFSPDGSRIAFVQTSEQGKGDTLYVKVVGAEPPLRLAEGASHPAWSPDGRRIAFVASEEGEGREARRYRLLTVPALGGAPREVADLGDRRPFGLAWSPDGRYLALGWSESEEEPYAVTLLSLATGERRRLSHPPPGIPGDGEPAFSPDGSTVAFLRNVYTGITDVYTVAAAGGAERRVTPASRKIADVDWSPGGGTLLVTLYEAGDHRLWSLPAGGGEPARVERVGEGAMLLAVDRRHRRLAYSRYSFHFRFWRVDLASGEAEPLPRLTSTRYDSELAFSPDGSRLAFTSTRSGSFEIWVSGAGGEDALRLTDFGGPFTGHPAWSPDGRWLAFTSAAGGDADVWRIEARGGLPRQLTFDASHELAPFISRDGRELYFASNRTGRWEIWRQALEGEAEARQLTRDGAFFAAGSPDGRWLYFTRRGEDGLWRQPLAGGEARRLPVELDAGSSGNWAVTPEGIYFFTRDEAHRPAVALFDPQRGSTRRLASLPGWPMNPCLALAPDGKSLLYTEGQSMESDIMIAEGLF